MKESKIGIQCDIAKDAQIEQSTLSDEVVIQEGCCILHSELGKKVMLDRNNSIIYSKLGRYCYTGFNTTVRNATLGSFNSISWNVSIGGNTHDLNHITTHSFLVYEKWGMGGHSNWQSASEECSIGNDVWIGSGANILRGVHIGDGAVIGASSVITKDVPPYAIVVGNPGKVIRYRCEERLIEELLELKWWELAEEKIREHLSLFQSELTLDIIEELKEIKNI